MLFRIKMYSIIPSFLLMNSSFANEAEPKRTALENIESQNHSQPLSAPLMPLVAPLSFVVPGSGHFLRGETQTGWRLLGMHALTFGTLLLVGAPYALSGAADSLSWPALPLLVVSASGWFSLSAADFYGAFSSKNSVPDSRPMVPRHKVGVYTLLIDDKLFDENFYTGLRSQFQWDDFLLRATFSTSQSSRIQFYGLGASYRILRWEKQSAEGLFVEVDTLHERNPHALYRQTTIDSRISAEVPFKWFGSSLEGLSTRYSLGYQHIFVKYLTSHYSKTDSENSLSGGFEVNAAIHEKATLFGGYNHARHDMYGALAGGFTGHFFLGANVELLPQIHLIEKFLFGSLTAAEVSIEARW